MFLQVLTHLCFAALLASPDDGEIVAAPHPDTPRLKPWTWTAREEREIAERVKSVREQDGVFRLRASGFNVEAEIDARFAAEVSLFMELFAEAFDEVLGWRPQDSVEPTVVIFDTKEEFTRRFPRGERGAFAYSWEGKRWSQFHIYTFVEFDAERTFANFPYVVLQHEGAHALSRRVFGRNEIPVWFDEGLGSWFQAYDLRRSFEKNKNLDHFERSEYFWHLRMLCGKYGERAPPLTFLTERTREDWNPDLFGVLARRNYGLAETLADFLVRKSKGRPYLQKLYEGIRKGKATDELLSEKELLRLEEQWQEHVQEILYVYRNTKPPPPKEVGDGG